MAEKRPAESVSILFNCLKISIFTYYTDIKWVKLALSTRRSKTDEDNPTHLGTKQAEIECVFL